MKTLLIPVLLVLGLCLSSCGEKCTTCSVTASGVTTAQPEFCGSSSEVKTYKEGWETTATAAGGTVACVDN